MQTSSQPNTEIYNNGKALPQVYRERVLDLHHQVFSQGQISQDTQVSVGYVNKVIQFYELVTGCTKNNTGSQ